VAARHEERVRNGHVNRITCNGPGCPGGVRYMDGAAPHSGASYRSVISGGIAMPTCPGRALFLRIGCVSALPDPAERRLGLIAPGQGRRLVLAVAPGTARALLVLPLTAGHADHLCIVRLGAEYSRRFPAAPGGDGALHDRGGAGLATDRTARAAAIASRGPGGLLHPGGTGRVPRGKGPDCAPKLTS
jgi:hypothetical protein